MTIDPFQVAVSGIGSDPLSIATLGYHFLTIEIVEPELFVGLRGGDISATQPPFHRKKKAELLMVRYKDRVIEYDPDRDKDKKLVNIEMKIGGHIVRRMVLVDAKKIPIIIQITNWLIRSENAIKVQVSNIQERVNKLKVSVGKIKTRWW